MKHDVELNRRPNVRRTGGKQICTCSSTTSRRGSDRSLQTLKEENRGKRREGGERLGGEGEECQGMGGPAGERAIPLRDSMINTMINTL